MQNYEKLLKMFRATHTPLLSCLLDDLLTSDTGAIARHLDVAPRTLERWKAADQAPRIALLALFYESRGVTASWSPRPMSR